MITSLGAFGALLCVRVVLYEHASICLVLPGIELGLIDTPVNPSCMGEQVGLAPPSSLNRAKPYAGEGIRTFRSLP